MNMEGEVNMRDPVVAVLMLVGAASAQGIPLISEVCVTPTEGEFVEIYNPTASSITLDNVYLCDLYGTSATITSFYPQIVAGAVTNVSADFLVRFPAGSSLPAGGVITVAMNGTSFQTTYGEAPDFELYNTGVGTQMTTPPNGYINSTAGLTNGDEVVVLFYWDGTTDRVYDLDYALWGDDTARRVDKSGISIDGPDAGSTPTSYMAEVAPASQSTISTAAHSSGNSYQRVDFTEGTEVTTGGNGLTGHDETSENQAVTWLISTATPGVIYTSLSRNTWGEIKTLLQP
jgi:hypothetical protein